MVVKVVKTSFKCEVCGEEYSTPEQASKCENRATEVPKHNVGDIVTVLSGDGAGLQATITRVFYYEPSWGGERYAHKVGYNADLIGHWGSRQLIQGVDVS